MKRILINGAIFASSFLFFAGAANAETLTVNNVGTCSDVTGSPAYCTIQAAVNAAASGDTVKVKKGTYDENVTINKALTLNGNHVGDAVSGRTFASNSESIITGTSTGSADITITAANVTVDGFSITAVKPAFSAIGIAVKASDAVIQNNIFDTITSADTGANGTAQAVYMASANDGTQILNNSMNNIHSNRSAKGILFGDNATGDGSTNTVVQGNTISNINSTIKGAYGISFGNTTNAQSGVTITGNTINGLTGGGWAHAIGVEGNAPNLNINKNTISNITASSTNLFGVWIESEDTSFTSATVNNNSLAVGGTTVGLGVDPALTGGTVNGTCNWWGDASGPSGAGSGSGSEVTSGATYTPWLTSSDLNGGCTGTPTFTVTIDKFVDGEMATAANTNSASFPMTSSWNALNLGAGSGSYALSSTGFNSPNAFEAVTSPMDQGASYTTSETMGSTVGLDCSSDPYALAGYSTGTSLAAAEGATPSMTAPNFSNLTQNEYVIVWNTDCATVTTNPATSITAGDATLNGTNGGFDATGHSFWVSTSPFSTASPSIPAGVYSTQDMGAIGAGQLFSASLSSLTTSGLPGNMPAVQPGTTYYVVAWSLVNGTWYPGQELSFTTTSLATLSSACSLGTAPAGYTIVKGTSANQMLTLMPNTMFIGKGGNDTLTGSAGTYILCLGGGNNTVNLGAGNDAVVTGNGNNNVTIGDGSEMVTTGSGNDTIKTGNGNSTIDGGNGNNVVKTGTGSYSITTGTGNDTITTQSTGNTINPGKGNNKVTQG